MFSPLCGEKKSSFASFLTIGHFSLDDSGLPRDALLALRRASKRKEGLILISGPTGSGKTTTLYSLLSELPQDKINISTLENPVEYQLPGINQVDVRPGCSFEESLRALMRQDPDVILIGEIRDSQTATLAFQASSTGHLVFSTVHAKGAKEAVARAINLGIDPFEVKSNLSLSASQRLVPLLCRHCAVPFGKEASSLKTLNQDGCSRCEGGVRGRIPIIEYMEEGKMKGGSLKSGPRESGGKRGSPMLWNSILFLERFYEETRSGTVILRPLGHSFDFFDSDIDYWPKKIRSSSKKIQKEKTPPPKKRKSRRVLSVGKSNSIPKMRNFLERGNIYHRGPFGSW